MHIAPGTEGIQPTNINWTLVLMTFIIFIAIGTLIYLMVTIIEAVKSINKALDQALTAQQLHAQQVQQAQNHMQNMPAQPITQPSVMPTQTAQTTNQYPAPSDKALNEAWKAGYESAKAQYESLQNTPANGDISTINNVAPANTTDTATNTATDTATDTATVETTETVVEDTASTDNASSTTDDANKPTDK